MTAQDIGTRADTTSRTWNTSRRSAARDHGKDQLPAWTARTASPREQKRRQRSTIKPEIRAGRWHYLIVFSWSLGNGPFHRRPRPAEQFQPSRVYDRDQKENATEIFREKSAERTFVSQHWEVPRLTCLHASPIRRFARAPGYKGEQRSIIRRQQRVTTSSGSLRLLPPCRARLQVVPRQEANHGWSAADIIMGRIAPLPTGRNPL